ncbi:MAG: ECF-type sigma factor [Thermoanaerobaculia bacterium]|nr:ECF-type sigma factor [Thermoanaerobaculia bacterium]
MSDETQGEITSLLAAHRRGEPEAFDRLVDVAYGELQRIAHGQLRRHRRGVTLETGALVHEVYMKMVRQSGLDVADSSHFLAVAARAMRQVIVSYARARNAAKRGGGERPVTLDEERDGRSEHFERVLDVQRALERLERHDERLARVVECRFFAGLSEEETAAALGVSLRTAQRDWMRARAWIRLELEAEPADD